MRQRQKNAHHKFFKIIGGIPKHVFGTETNEAISWDHSE